MITTIYLGHPASTDASGLGLAKTIIACLEEFGIDRGTLARSFRGVCADGGILNVNITGHLLKLFFNTEQVGISRTMTYNDAIACLVLPGILV